MITHQEGNLRILARISRNAYNPARISLPQGFLAMRRLVAALFAVALLASPVALAAEGKHYSDPAAAAKACKSPVVWVNPQSGIYHMSGSRYYGTTKDGFYMCQKAAEAAGNRQAESH